MNENGVTVRVATGLWSEDSRAELAQALFEMGVEYSSTRPLSAFPGSDVHYSILIHCTTDERLDEVEKRLNFWNIPYDKLWIDMKGHGNGTAE